MEGKRPSPSDSAAQVRKLLLTKQGSTLDDRIRAGQLEYAVQIAKTKEEKQRAEQERVSFMEALKAERLEAIKEAAQPGLPSGRIRLKPSVLNASMQNLPAPRPNLNPRSCCCCCCCCKPAGANESPEPPGSGSTEPPGNEPPEPSGCITLAPVALNLSNVRLMPPALPGNNTIGSCSSGAIGLMSGCTGPGIFVNGDDGAVVGYIEQVFRGTASATGVAELSGPTGSALVDCRCGITGDFLGQAGDNRPDSSLELTMEVDYLVENDVVSLTSTNLLDVETIGSGVDSSIHQFVNLPTQATLFLNAGDRIEYIMRLRINSWSSKWGTVAVFVNNFHVAANTDDVVRVCY